MNSVLLWVGGLLVAVLALLFAVPYAVDWNNYRGVFEEEASRLLGRDVRVGGRVDLRLLPKPFVRFEKVRIADVGRMQGEPFFRAESFTLWLSIPPLLRGAIEANDVELDRPTLNLAVDDQGVGNWRSLQVTPGALPFLPSDVALQAVRIRDGAVTFRDLTSRATMSLTGIEGELSAPALNGPFRFRGDLLSGGERHEVRLSTTIMEPDGKLRLKATVRTLDSQNAFTLDGAVSDLATRPRLDGTLSAKLPLAPAAAGSGAGARAVAPVVFELQSQLAADAKGARLNDITLGFEQDGRPQLLTGALTTVWGAARSTNLDLNSRWLDLDRVTGSGVAPLDAVRDLAGRFAAIMPQEGTSRAAIAVEQVNLGGEPVGSVNLALVRRDGGLELEDLSGLVPGNGRLAVQGRFGAAQGRAPPPFSGDLVVRGASLQRLLTWAFPGRAIVTGTKAEAPFSLAGELTVSGDLVGLANASMEIHGARLNGRVEHRGGEKPELAVALEGDVIDVSVLAPEFVRLDAWRRVLGLDPSATGNEGALEAFAAKGTLKLDVRAGRLGDGAATLQDVVVDLTAGRGRIDIPALRLRTADGLTIDARASVEGAAGHHSGTIAGWVAAPSADAAQQLARQLETLLPGSRLVVSSHGLTQLAPLDLGFSATLGKAPAARATLRVDGTAAGSRVNAVAALDGGLANWRTAPIDASAQVDSPDIAAFAARLYGRAVTPAGSEPVEPGAAAGRATVKLAGANAESLSALAEIDSAPVKASLQSVVALREGRESADIQGDLSIVAKDVAAALDLLAPQLRLRLGGLGVNGAMSVAQSGNVLTIGPRRLNIGGAELAGEIKATTDGGLTRISGRLAAARGSLADLIGMATAPRGRSQAGDGGLASVWSDDVFDFSGLAGLEARLVLAFAALDMGDGLSLADANLDLVLTPERIAIPRLEGRALGAPLSGRLELTRAVGGADLALAGRIGPVPLADILGKAAGGSASANVDVKGRAASLRGLVIALAGGGQVVLADARLLGLAPQAIDKLADQQLASAAAPRREDLIAAVRRALAGSVLGVGSRRLEIQIADGAAKLAPLEVAVESGRAVNMTTADLLALKVDSEWTLTSTRRKSAVGGELPSISLAYVGPLKDVLATDPRVSVEALERELSVRRMERDVERLEQLRREDEERIRRGREQREGATGFAPRDVDTGAPVIEAPLPIPGQKTDTTEPRPGNPAASGGALKRPPVKTEARPRSLEDVLQAR